MGVAMAVAERWGAPMAAGGENRWPRSCLSSCLAIGIERCRWGQLKRRLRPGGSNLSRRRTAELVARDRLVVRSSPTPSFGAGRR
jgi:hypothetical protein